MSSNSGCRVGSPPVMLIKSTRPLDCDDPVHRAADFVDRHVVQTIVAIVGEADRAAEIAGIGDREHGQLARRGVPGAGAAIVRTALLRRRCPRQRRMVGHRADALGQVPRAVRRDQGRLVRTAGAQALLPDLTVAEEHPRRATERQRRHIPRTVVK